ncbi:hypothetical protein HDU79_008245 [Rhizoclosmatium sp. JEL0117]|nr:hypothetical protein HDU79_008245 [Rhizoclosmatium sp. JEL0117]
MSVSNLVSSREGADASSARNNALNHVREELDQPSDEMRTGFKLYEKKSEDEPRKNRDNIKMQKPADASTQVEDHQKYSKNEVIQLDRFRVENRDEDSIPGNFVQSDPVNQTATIRESNDNVLPYLNVEKSAVVIHATSDSVSNMEPRRFTVNEGWSQKVGWANGDQNQGQPSLRTELNLRTVSGEYSAGIVDETGVDVSNARLEEQGSESISQGGPSRTHSGSVSFKKQKRSRTATDYEDGEYTSTRSKRLARPANYKEGKPDLRSDIAKIVLFETYHGFIEDPLDAVYVVQGTLEGVLPAFKGNAEEMASIKVRSGTVIVMPEKGLTVKRWRDGIKWSPSRAYGQFLLYRQIELKDPGAPDEPDVTHEPAPYSTPYGSTTGLQPTFTARTLKEGTQITENGLTKRTITVRGSDGEKHRVVSYYNSKDVMEMIRKMQRKEENDVLIGFMRATEDNRLKEMVKKSGVDALGLVRQSFPDWKPESFGTKVSPRREPTQSKDIMVKVKEEAAVLVGQSRGSSFRQDSTIRTVVHQPPPTRGHATGIVKDWSYLYVKDFAGYHPYKNGAQSYDAFRKTSRERVDGPGYQHHQQYQDNRGLYPQYQASRLHTFQQHYQTVSSPSFPPPPTHTYDPRQYQHGQNSMMAPIYWPNPSPSNYAPPYPYYPDQH